uniref:Uncharacterized protein n=1 Tax=viral metagenome TaxID=1070528 RepID=A0A6C0H6D7_9ZZZZ
MEDYLNNIDTDIIKIITNENGVISGSSAVYYYMIKNNLSPTFEPNDIDIYLPENTDMKPYFNKLSKNDGVDFLKYVFVFKQYFYTIYKFSYNDKFIDVIILNAHNRNDILYIINKTFDFNVCKTYYDGKNIRAMYPLAFTKGYIDYYSEKRINEMDLHLLYNCINYNEIMFNEINKNIVDINMLGISCLGDPYNILRRIVKYKNRGFNVKIPELLFQLLSLKKTNLCLKIKKYSKTDYPLLSDTELYYMMDPNNMILLYKYRLKEIHFELIKKMYHPSKVFEKIDLKK